MEVRGNQWIVSTGVDEAFSPETWTIDPVDGRRIYARWSNGRIEFDVGRGEPGSAEFTVHAVSPAPSAVEAFVRGVVFEKSGPFVRQP